MNKIIILSLTMLTSFSSYAGTGDYFKEVEAAQGPCIASVGKMEAVVVCEKNRKTVRDSGYSNAFLVLLGEMKAKGYSLKGNCFHSKIDFINTQSEEETTLTCIFE